MKPEAYRIDKKRRNTANLPKPGGFAILYRCPHCGQKFNIFINEKELNYCYNCGESLFWGGVILYLNSKLSDILSEAEKKLGPGKDYNSFELGLIHRINEENEKTDGSDPVYLMEEE